MSEANDIITGAIERGLRRAAARPRPDYDAANKAFQKQKAALKRAQASGRDAVVLAVEKAVAEWAEPPFSGAWPDDWSAWQRALDDVLPWNQRVDISDL